MEAKPRITAKRLLKGIQRKAVDVLGLDLLSKQYSTLALNYVFIMVYYTVETVFVNTLIFRVTGGDMYSVLTYRGLVYLFSAVGMNICSYFSRVITPVRAIKTAGVLYALLFALMFGWMDRLEHLMYYIGVLSGISMGMYWSGHNVLLALYTTPRNRAVGIGITGIISGVMNLTLPLIFGFVLQWMPGMTGYRVVFGISIATILAQFYFMNRLTLIERKHRPRDYRFALKLVVHKLSLRVMMFFEFSRGIREGAFTFFLNMLLFALVTDEALVGFNSFLTGVFSILAAWVFGRVVTPSRRIRLTLVSIGGIFICCLGLLLRLDVLTVLIFGAVNTFLAYFFNNIGSHICYEIMAQNETLRGIITELTGLREGALGGGRIVGLVILACFPKTLDGYLYAMLTLTAIQFITVALMQWAQRILTRKQNREKGVVAT